MRDPRRRDVGAERFDAGDLRRVDFVEDGTLDGTADQLAQPASQAWRPRLEEFLRGRYGLPLVVVVAALALLVGKALLHQKPAGAPPAAPSPTPSVSRAGVGLPLRTGSDPTRCPGLQCYTTPSVPAPVRAAVRAVFPTARFDAVETIRLVDGAQGDPLWYREVDARAGTSTLTVKVQAPAAGDRPHGNSADDGSQSSTSLDAALQQWFVRVHVTDRSGTADVLDQLRRLAADARLLAT